MENLADIEIILIEDNPFDAELTLRSLQKIGLAGQVKVFPDGVEALQFLAAAVVEPHGRLKAIFLDLKLPKMSGLEVLG